MVGGSGGNVCMWQKYYTSLLYGISWKFPNIYLYGGKSEAKVFTSILERGVSAKPAIIICCHFCFAKDRLQANREGRENYRIPPSLRSVSAAGHGR